MILKNEAETPTNSNKQAPFPYEHQLELAKSFNDEDIEKYKLRALLINIYVHARGQLNGSIFRLEAFKHICPNVNLLYKAGSLNISYIASVIKRKGEESRLASLFELDEFDNVTVAPNRSANDGIRLIQSIYESIKNDPKYVIDVNGVLLASQRSNPSSSTSAGQSHGHGQHRMVYNQNMMLSAPGTPNMMDPNQNKVFYNPPAHVIHFLTNLGYQSYEIHLALLKAFALLIHRCAMYFKISIQDAIASYEHAKLCEKVDYRVISKIVAQSLTQIDGSNQMHTQQNNDGFCWYDNYNNQFIFHYHPPSVEPSIIFSLPEKQRHVYLIMMLYDEMAKMPLPRIVNITQTQNAQPANMANMPNGHIPNGHGHTAHTMPPGSHPNPYISPILTRHTHLPGQIGHPHSPIAHNAQVVQQNNLTQVQIPSGHIPYHGAGYINSPGMCQQMPGSPLLVQQQQVQQHSQPLQPHQQNVPVPVSVVPVSVPPQIIPQSHTQSYEHPQPTCTSAAPPGPPIAPQNLPYNSSLIPNHCITLKSKLSEFSQSLAQRHNLDYVTTSELQIKAFLIHLALLSKKYCHPVNSLILGFDHLICVTKHNDQQTAQNQNEIVDLDASTKFFDKSGQSIELNLENKFTSLVANYTNTCKPTPREQINENEKTSENGSNSEPMQTQTGTEITNSNTMATEPPKNGPIMLNHENTSILFNLVSTQNNYIQNLIIKDIYETSIREELPRFEGDFDKQKPVYMKYHKDEYRFMLKGKYKKEILNRYLPLQIQKSKTFAFHLHVYRLMEMFRVEVFRGKDEVKFSGEIGLVSTNLDKISNMIFNSCSKYLPDSFEILKGFEENQKIIKEVGIRILAAADDAQNQHQKQVKISQVCLWHPKTFNYSFSPTPEHNFTNNHYSYLVEKIYKDLEDIVFRDMKFELCGKVCFGSNLKLAGEGVEMVWEEK